MTQQHNYLQPVSFPLPSNKEINNVDGKSFTFQYDASCSTPPLSSSPTTTECIQQNPSSNEMELILKILHQAEDTIDDQVPIIPSYPMGSTVADNNNNNNIFSCTSKTNLTEFAELLEPTPIGPNGITSVVNKRPKKEALSSSLIGFAPPPKRHCIGFRVNEEEEASKKNQQQILQEELEQQALLQQYAIHANHNTQSCSSVGFEMNRYRQYQSDQWDERFQELKDFYKKVGHCMVPYTYTESPQLAQWVKRQRYQYKLKQAGRKSTLSDQRQQFLEDLDFCWDSHEASWLERFQVLLAFKKEHGHCNVPSKYSDRSLAIWVKCQRRQCKLFNKGKRSTMTLSRLRKLEEAGFDWNPRNLLQDT